jgi:nucleotide-binding universal stress UspA family protein
MKPFASEHSSQASDELVEAPDLQDSALIGKILFATDFSSCSGAALTHVSSIAKAFKSRVYLVHAIPPEEWRWIPPEVAGTTAHEQQRRFAETQMARLAGSECLKQIPHHAFLEEGRTWDVLAKVVRQNDIDLIVIGTHGRTGVEKLVLGSVAEEVLRSAACPVLTVGPRVSSGVTGQERQEILYASDFTSSSHAAAPYAISLAQGLRAHLTLLHVGPHPRDMFPYEKKEIAASAMVRLRKLVPADTKMCWEPDFAVQFGNTAPTILNFAIGCRTDFIVLGARRGGRAFVRASTHLPGGIAYKIVCEAHCPVLTVQSTQTL